MSYKELAHLQQVLFLSVKAILEIDIEYSTLTDISARFPDLYTIDARTYNTFKYSFYIIGTHSNNVLI